MSKLAEKVQRELIQAIDNDELVLPTLPEVALKVREAAEDPDIGIAQLSKVIGNDAALTARIVKVVNSPLLRTNKEITDLQMAVARLGPDQATLAGLVHKIGVLPILTYAEDHSELLADSISLNHVIEQINPIIGDKILRTWDFPELIAMVPSQYLDFSRDSAKVDYVDIVQVATLQSYLGSEHPYTQLDWSQIPAFRKLGLDPSQNLNDDEDLSAAMEAAMSMLQ